MTISNPLADRPKSRAKVTAEQLEEAAASFNRMRHNHENGIEHYVGEDENGKAALLVRRVAPSIRPVAHLEPLKRAHTEAEITARAKKVEAARKRLSAGTA